jgi:Fur family peroxide stress response transcriptional regulator
MQTHSIASITNTLRRKGYKATSQRIAICRLALRSHHHLSARGIHATVRQEYPTVSLATVYKTLHVLRDLGSLQELVVPQAETRYDFNVQPHINLVCLRCGQITDADDNFARKIVIELATRERFTPKEHCLDLYGVCRKCS